MTDESNWYDSIVSTLKTALDNSYASTNHSHSNYLTKSNVYYGKSTTSESTQTKVITDVSDWTFDAGNVLFVYFRYGNSYSGTAKLSINGTVKDVRTASSESNHRYLWTSYEVVCFVYDGTLMRMVEQGVASTSYYGVTKLSSSTSSTSTELSATPYAVKLAYDKANSAYTLADGKADGTHNHTVSQISDFPTSHPTTFITNSEEYDNIKSGESTTLTLTNQKLVNDAIDTKISSLNSRISSLETELNDLETDLNS